MLRLLGLEGEIIPMFMMMMLEAHVAPEKWEALRDTFEVLGTRNLPSQIHEIYLVQSATDSTLWRIVSVWHSREDWEEMRRYGPFPGERIFRSAGAEPIISTWDVVLHGVGGRP